MSEEVSESTKVQLAKAQQILRHQNKAAPVDPRFATTVDQYKYCWSSYNEMLRCWSRNGFKADKCEPLVLAAYDICPADQIKQFYEQRRDDKWHGFDYPMQEGELQEGDVITKREKHHAAHH